MNSLSAVGLLLPLSRRMQSLLMGRRGCVCRYVLRRDQPEDFHTCERFVKRFGNCRKRFSDSWAAQRPLRGAPLVSLRCCRGGTTSHGCKGRRGASRRGAGHRVPAVGVQAAGVPAVGLSRAGSESINTSACQLELRDVAGVSGSDQRELTQGNTMSSGTHRRTITRITPKGFRPGNNRTYFNNHVNSIVVVISDTENLAGSFALPAPGPVLV